MRLKDEAELAKEILFLHGNNDEISIRRCEEVFPQLQFSRSSLHRFFNHFSVYKSTKTPCSSEKSINFEEDTCMIISVVLLVLFIIFDTNI